MAQATLCIVYHSQSGANEVLAQAAYAGAVKAESIAIKVLRASDVNSKALLNCDGLILCFAEMNGSIAGGMKECLDRIYYPLTAQQKVLPTIIYMGVGNDGTGAQALYGRIAKGLNLKPVNDALIVRGIPSAADLEQIEEQSHGFAEGLAMGIY